ncbi:membrane protein [Curtobacterium sp. S6]|uniref:DoxX family protein n=1 Tax=Curtobacterium sp. S6 TaxID=1479623 RepID=UPI0004AA151F|nr:membrane protein [Curtobacterium sp. S6]
MTNEKQKRRAHRSARFQGIALGAMGVLHGLRPEPFDRLIPPRLPGSARLWTLGSGALELGVAGLLLYPRTRRIGGLAAAALYVGVWPGNFQMAWDSRGASPTAQAIAWGRLPLQLPLIASAVQVYRHVR